MGKTLKGFVGGDLNISAYPKEEICLGVGERDIGFGPHVDPCPFPTTMSTQYVLVVGRGWGWGVRVGKNKMLDAKQVFKSDQPRKLNHKKD
jgi:hypothetical protein